MNFKTISPIIKHIILFFIIQITYNLIKTSWQYKESTGNEAVEEKQLSEIIQLYDGSSMWCNGANKSERICKFRNLCYHPIYKEFVFFHGNKTAMSGLPKDRFSPALLDMSSVDDHNTQYFNFIDFPIDSLDSFKNIKLYNGLSFIFNRFNSENIMHVVHDDLLPLFHTMKEFSYSTKHKPFDVENRLVFMEGWTAGPYFELYKLFSNKAPLLKEDLLQTDNLKCFQHAVVGISKATTWYQYGFKIPQAPLPNTQVTAKEIQEFIGFIREQLGVQSVIERQPYIVLCLRKYNRLILNEDDLALAMTRQFGMEVIQVSMTTHSMQNMIQVISNASALVGMHGSALVLSMFLPPGAVLIEIFPYAINPDNYLPYKTLAEIQGMGIIYESWRNIFPENTVTHPDEDPYTGGIKHLPKDVQGQIQSTLEVPPHICCNNPSWLYRIYQDTIVDEASFLEVMKNAFYRSKHLNTNRHDISNQLFPSKVLNISCTPSSDTLYPALSISWSQPVNVMYFKNASIKYEVWIQRSDENDYTAYILPFTQYVFGEGLDSKTEYRVWVRCIAFDNMVGSFGVSATCTTY